MLFHSVNNMWCLPFLVKAFCAYIENFFTLAHDECWQVSQLSANYLALDSGLRNLLFSVLHKNFFHDQNWKFFCHCWNFNWKIWIYWKNTLMKRTPGVFLCFSFIVSTVELQLSFVVFGVGSSVSAEGPDSWTTGVFSFTMLHLYMELESTLFSFFSNSKFWSLLINLFLEKIQLRMVGPFPLWKQQG